MNLENGILTEKPGKRGHIWYHSIYIKDPESKYIERES